jgi:hypothetical protein
MMGDLVCTTAECTTGANSVTAMDSYFQSLDPGSQATFKARRDAIMAQFNAAYSWYSPYIPFNPACCDVLTIGQAADGLLCQMEGGVGCVSPSSGDGSMSLSTMIVLGAVAFLAIQYVINKR